MVFCGTTSLSAIGGVPAKVVQRRRRVVPDPATRPCESIADSPHARLPRTVMGGSVGRGGPGCRLPERFQCHCPQILFEHRPGILAPPESGFRCEGR